MLVRRTTQHSPLPLSFTETLAMLSVVLIHLVLTEEVITSRLVPVPLRPTLSLSLQTPEQLERLGTGG